MSSLTPQQQFQLLDELHVFKIHGCDKHDRTILRILAKFFAARMVSADVMKKYLEEKIYPELEKCPFSILYVHTGVEKTQNFPGISALRSFHDAIPANVIHNLHAVYFLHPGLHSRLFLATFGRFIFSSRLYSKLKYMNRIGYLYEHIKRDEVELPKYVYDHDQYLEFRPLIDYELENDHPRMHSLRKLDCIQPTYFTGCNS